MNVYRGEAAPSLLQGKVEPKFKRAWRWAVDENANIRAVENQSRIALALIVLFSGKEI